MGYAVLEAVEDPSLVQVRGMDGVTGLPEPLGEGDDPGRQSVRVVEQQHLSHSASPSLGKPVLSAGIISRIPDTLGRLCARATRSRRLSHPAGRHWAGRGLAFARLGLAVP